jgi:lipoprotein-anchoring transpeptidase ErfK/SrfK
MVKGKFKADDGNVYTTTKQGYITGLQYYKKRYKTFVLIDISSQNLKYYIKGKKNMSVSVVTGTPGDRATPTGVFSVQTKARNVTLTGPTWSVPVSYWMPFIDGAYGMHDASFRSESEFKNHRTYITNGSHGCVNMPYYAAEAIYNNVDTGTAVILY